MTEQEFTQFVCLHSPSLRRYISFMVPAAYIEDVLSATWQTLWTSLPSYDPAKGELIAYTKHIAKCRAIDETRALCCRLTVHSPFSSPIDEHYELAAPATFSETPSDFSLRVRSLLNGLPPAQALVLRLYLFDNQTLAEIAEATGSPLSTIKTRYTAGLARLRLNV